MPIVLACCNVAWLMMIPADFVKSLNVSEVKTDPLSVNIRFGTYACCVKIPVSALIIACESTVLRGTANK